MIIDVELCSAEGKPFVDTFRVESGCREILLGLVRQRAPNYHAATTMTLNTPLEIVYPRVTYRCGVSSYNKELFEQWCGEYVPIFQENFKVRITMEHRRDAFRGLTYIVNILPRFDLPVSFAWTAFWWWVEWQRLWGYKGRDELSHRKQRQWDNISHLSKTFPISRSPSDMELFYARHVNGVETWHSYRRMPRLRNVHYYLYRLGIQYGFSPQWRKEFERVSDQ